MSNPFVYEFLYRGGPDGSAWHVVLAEHVEVLGQTSLVTSAPMTPDQALNAGFPLGAVIDDINAQLMAELTAAQARIAELTAQSDTQEA